MKTYLAFLFLGLIVVKPACSADLIQVYEDSLHNDPSFQQAFNQYLSAKQAIPQARSQLLPQLSATGLAARNSLKVKQGHAVSTEQYDSEQWNLIASQAIFNYKGWMQVAQAKASVKAAQANFDDACQDLMLRTTKAYLDVLLAKDALDFAKAKKLANQRQLEQAQERFKVGLVAITPVYEAQAGYDQSVAEVITAQNNQINMNENLRKLTNKLYSRLARLKGGKVPLIQPKPNKAQVWSDRGLKQNYKLQAARFNLEAAKDNIKVQMAGAVPSLALQGSSTGIMTQGPDSNQFDQASFFAPDLQSTASIGLAVTVPVFQGGLVIAKTRQANYDYQASSDVLERVRRDVVVNSRIAFNNINAGISQIKADRQTVISRVNSLESTEAQFNAGTRTMVDVVNAQQNLFESQLRLATDQYNFIGSILNLKYLAGTLSPEDLRQVNAWLQVEKPRKREKHHVNTSKSH